MKLHLACILALDVAIEIPLGGVFHDQIERARILKGCVERQDMPVEHVGVVLDLAADAAHLVGREPRFHAHLDNAMCFGRDVLRLKDGGCKSVADGAYEAKIS